MKICRFLWAGLALSLTASCGGPLPLLESDAGDAWRPSADVTTGATIDVSTDVPADVPAVDRSAPAGRCGDGVVGPGEACDDGNDDPTDGCTSDCRLWVMEPAEMGFEAGEAILDPSLMCRPMSVHRGWAARGPVRVPYRINLCTRDDGSDAFALASVRAVMGQVAATFRAAGVELFEHSVTRFRFNDCVTQYEESRLDDLIRGSGVPAGVVPITFVRAIESRTSAFTIGGYAWFRGRPVNAGTSHRVVAHELGHFFGLGHTHSCRLGRETGANCDRAGDLLCDTPPDRGPRGVNGLDRCDDGATLNGSCSAAGCGAASCPDGARPDAENLMSYYACARRLSGQQADFVRCTLANELREYGRETCADECPTAQARSCSGGALRTCGNHDGDACLEWSPPTACPAGQTCATDRCVAQCVAGAACPTGNPCTIGTVRCAGTSSSCAASPRPAGTPCGSAMTCNGQGVCVASPPAGQVCRSGFAGSGSGGMSGARCLARYTFQVVRGGTYTISTCGRSTGDPFLSVSGACTCSNDDSCGLGSQCTCTATATGVATICASTFATQSATWSYQVSSANGGCNAPAGSICRSGFAGSGNGGMSGARCLARYSFPVTRGHRYTISTCGRSTGDPFLSVGGACTCSNDDSCGLGSQCTCTATATGVATICASTFATQPATWSYQVSSADGGCR
ncbi:MAG: hypothetical protein Q8S73_10850 [Deltaproteobacteria bacterium]|nr:hypothetical protein [Myxococcales bacterium]MDP3214593.1 hypothetical protein [Deltaproteobacteria bacterium]